MKQIHIIVSGDVQGVSFRIRTCRFGKKNSLNGRVWNNPDGTVEIFAQGEKDDLIKLLEWSKTGEGSACVTKVQYDWEDPEELYDDFLILR